MASPGYLQLHQIRCFDDGFFRKSPQDEAKETLTGIRNRKDVERERQTIEVNFKEIQNQLRNQVIFFLSRVNLIQKFFFTRLDAEQRLERLPWTKTISYFSMLHEFIYLLIPNLSKDTDQQTEYKKVTHLKNH